MPPADRYIPAALAPPAAPGHEGSRPGRHFLSVREMLSRMAVSAITFFIL